MEQEVALALVGVAGSFAGAGVYVARKWADAKAAMVGHEVEMQKVKQKHDMDMEQRRMQMEDARIERDRETAGYIAVNTEVIRSIQAAMDELTGTIQSKLGNGMTGIMRDNADMLVQHNISMMTEIKSLSLDIKSIRDVVEEIKGKIE